MKFHSFEKLLELLEFVKNDLPLEIGVEIKGDDNGVRSKFSVDQEIPTTND